MVGAGILDEGLNTPVTIGSNSIPIAATDASGNTTNQHIQLSVSGSGSQTLTYDPNGNLTSDGTRTFEWDPLNRLTAVSSGTQRSGNTISEHIRVTLNGNNAQSFAYDLMITCSTMARDQS